MDAGSLWEKAGGRHTIVANMNLLLCPINSLHPWEQVVPQPIDSVLFSLRGYLYKPPYSCDIQVSLLFREEHLEKFFSLLFCLCLHSPVQTVLSNTTQSEEKSQGIPTLYVCVCPKIHMQMIL